MPTEPSADSIEHLLALCFPLAPGADHTRPICDAPTGRPGNY